jgi:hypothetical protein
MTLPAPKAQAQTQALVKQVQAVWLREVAEPSKFRMFEERNALAAFRWSGLQGLLLWQSLVQPAICGRTRML